jgi:hypothetical protein
VRPVTPDLAFEGILRWRLDKKPADADTLEHVRALLPAEDQQAS